MRTLVIGDIHGCLNALETLAEYVGLNPNDRVITLGDYVDRGPDTKGCIEFLIALRDRGQLIALLGNHEMMMLDARNEPLARNAWLRFGGEETLASYGTNGLDDVPQEHWDFIESCRDYYELPGHYFVHANARPDLALDEQSEATLFWEKFDERPPHKSGKIMVCGHTSQHDGVPLESEGRAVCIDTWAYGDGWLTCLDVESGHYWQCNQQGERREGDLGDWWRA